MNVKLQITGIFSEEDIDREFHQLSIDCVDKIRTKGFSGLDVLVYIITFGGGVTVVQLANLIIKIIEKDKLKSLTINDIEIKGYSYKQTEKLLTKIFENNGKSDGDK